MHRFVANQQNTRVALSLCTKTLCAPLSPFVASVRNQGSFASDVNQPQQMQQLQQQQMQQQPGQGQPYQNRPYYPPYNNNNNNPNAGTSGNMNSPYYNNPNFRSTPPRTPLPPAFDVIHWDDNNFENGYLLRVVYRDSFIVLDYHRQVRKSTDEVFVKADRLVTVTLPPVYIARFLGVLEGRMDKVEVQSRYTNATFTTDPTREKHHHVLRCVSMRPTTAMQQSVDGSDVNEEAIEWTVNFDVAESLMLHRFLSEALKYNSGFARRQFS